MLVIGFTINCQCEFFTKMHVKNAVIILYPLGLCPLNSNAKSRNFKNIVFCMTMAICHTMFSHTKLNITTAVFRDSQTSPISLASIKKGWRFKNPLFEEK